MRRFFDNCPYQSVLRERSACIIAVPTHQSVSARKEHYFFLNVAVH